MADNDPRIKVIEKIIKSGEVRHDRIKPALDRAGLSQMDSDDVSELVQVHKYLKTRWARVRLMREVRDLADKIGSYISAIIGAGVIAETMAAREFAGSLMGEKLQGFGDNFLFWLGIKKIEISGPDMARAMTAVGLATPKIVKGIVIGLVLGYVGWKVITRVMGYLLRTKRRRRDIMNLLDRHPMVADENNVV
ncbi:hypothetical protein ACFL6S_06685 [Candidatus Poribacteria bacterium]